MRLDVEDLVEMIVNLGLGLGTAGLHSKGDGCTVAVRLD